MTITTAASADHHPEGEADCFVIGPIGDEHAEADSDARRVYEQALTVYEEVIRAACRRHGLSTQRADDIADAGEITDQIRRRLIEADLVIADVSGANPNVMYELGFRDAHGRPVILIGQTGDLPFDIARKRTIRFKRERPSLIQARDHLDRFLGEGISKGFAATTAFGPSDGSTTLPAQTGADTAERALDDEPGLFEQMVEVEEALGSIGEDMDSITEALEEMADAARHKTPQMEELNRAGGPASARLALVKEFSDAITGPAASMRSGAEAFAARLTQIDQGIMAQLDFIEALSPEDRDSDTQQFMEQLVETAEAMATSAESISEFGETVHGMVGYSRLLRSPGRDISVAVRTLATLVELTGAWASRARGLM